MGSQVSTWVNREVAPAVHRRLVLANREAADPRWEVDDVNLADADAYSLQHGLDRKEPVLGGGSNHHGVLQPLTVLHANTVGSDHPAQPIEQLPRLRWVVVVRRSARVVDPRER